jgi:hypothetical protein
VTGKYRFFEYARSMAGFGKVSARALPRISQCVLDHPKERFRLEWFPDDRVWLGINDPCNLVRAATRHEDYFYAWVQTPNSVRQFNAVHAGHHHIKQSQIDLGRIVLKQAQSFLSAADRHYAVPTHSQHSLTQGQRNRLIIDQQDGIHS